jgi:hypothetical protein
LQLANAAAAGEKKYAAAARASHSDEPAGGKAGGTGPGGTGGSAADPLLGAVTMQQVDFNEALVEEREQSALEIAAAVAEVNEVFRDLATLVDEQGRDIDQIELNIGDAHTETEAGVGHLEKAATYQGRYRKWIIVLIVIIILAAGGLTTYFLLSKK